MFSYLLFFSLLLILYFLSQAITRALSLVLYKLSSSQSFSMYVLASILFPGVVIHELSHYITAVLLGVHAGEIEFLPKVIDGRLKLGSVQIQKTDPFRKTLIGVAPLFGGISVLLLSVYLYKTFFPDSIIAFILIGVFYYQVANTMFSSRKDLEGTGVFFILFLISLISLWFFNVPVLPFLEDSTVGIFMQSLFQRASFYLQIAVIVDIAVLIFLMGISKLR